MLPLRALLTTALCALLGACVAQPTSPAPTEVRGELGAPSVPIGQGPPGARGLISLIAHRPQLRPFPGADDRLIARDWDDAIDDLRYAALTATVEDGWVCIRRGQRTWWKNIGVAEGPTQASLKLRPGDPDLVGADELTFVHYHPVQHVLRETLLPRYRAASRGTTLSLDEFWWSNHREEHLFRAPPSLTDFEADAVLRRALRRTHPRVAIGSAVVTALALYRFSASPQRRAWLIDQRPAARAAWRRATAGLTSLEQLLSRLDRLGLQVESQPLPGGDWDALKHWFVVADRRDENSEKRSS